ncbi:MAG: hypothetical protein LBC12_08135 [Nitrososphaerota archaeon]|nr:hypothetical protein [Nitrososphaerota archaeon]
MNGTRCAPKTLCFTFSIEGSPENGYITKFVLMFDDFYDEISMPVTVSNGRIFIDSTPTIFVVNPDSLIDGHTVQLYQTENITLSGNVINAEQPTSTLIKNCQVVSTMVRGSYQQTDDSGLLVGPALLLFDTNTGVLVRAAGQFSDVLLDELGIAFIYGGVFDLLDFSENLDFTLVHTSFSLWLLILIPIFVIAFLVVVFLAYKSIKTKKGGKRKAPSNKSLKTRSYKMLNAEGIHYKL